MFNFSQVKKVLKNILPKKIFLFIYNRFNLIKIPLDSNSVVSDLFPFKILNEWETSFELLNIPKLIDPSEENYKKYKITLLFFDENGNLFLKRDINKVDGARHTININELIKNESISGYGTFACFHRCILPNLESDGGFLAERGYTGYTNSNFSNVKGFVHGNLDALAMNKEGKLKCLGGSFIFQKYEFRLQHQLVGPATYEFGFVNTSNSKKSISLEIISNIRSNFKEKKLVLSKGIVWFSYNLDRNEKARVIVYSNLNLPRPVVFRIENNSFDVFHG
jgi:hypothetical protein